MAWRVRRRGSRGEFKGVPRSGHASGGKRSPVILLAVSGAVARSREGKERGGPDGRGRAVSGGSGRWQVGRGAGAGRRARLQAEQGERGRALCGREAPGWLTGGPDWDGASRGVGRCALGGQARAGFGPSGLLGRIGWREGFGPSGEGWAGLFWVWAPFLIPFLSISFLF